MTPWLPRRAREEKVRELLADTPAQERSKLGPVSRPVSTVDIEAVRKVRRRERNKVARASRKATVAEMCQTPWHWYAGYCIIGTRCVLAPIAATSAESASSQTVDTEGVPQPDSERSA